VKKRTRNWFFAIQGTSFTHIPVKLVQRDDDSRFVQFEHRIRPGKDFPPEFSAIWAIQREEGCVRFREGVGLERGDGVVNAVLLDFVDAPRRRAENLQNDARRVGEEALPETGTQMPMPYG